MAKAALAAGADGLLIEIHPDPENAMSDSGQALDFDTFIRLMSEIDAMSELLGRITTHT